MRKNASALAGTLERANDVQQVGVVALFGRRCAEVFEPLMPIVLRVETGAPPFVIVIQGKYSLLLIPPGTPK